MGGWGGECTRERERERGGGVTKSVTGHVTVSQMLEPCCNRQVSAALLGERHLLSERHLLGERHLLDGAETCLDLLLFNVPFSSRHIFQRIVVGVVVGVVGFVLCIHTPWVA